MQEQPPEPNDPMENSDLPFAGLLKDLLQEWESAEAQSAGDAMALEADAPSDDAEFAEPISADVLLSRFSAEQVIEDVEPQVEPVQAEEPAEESQLASLLSLDSAFRSDEDPAPALAEPVVEPVEEFVEPAAESVENLVEPVPDTPVEDWVEQQPERAPVPEPASTPEPAGDGALAALMGSIEQEIRKSDSATGAALRKDSRSLERYITFALAGATYALELKGVLETDRLPRSTNVPGTPVFVRGVTNLRGEILALLDLRLLFDLEPAEQPGAGRMLVVKETNSGSACGLIVDRLGGMALMAREELQPIQQGVEDKVSAVLSGIGEHRGRLVNVLDLEKLFATSEIRELAGV
jgi:purine-binding chemotaxis protein CheW